ncbi:MAG TPA: hypothetical protein GX530_06255 [Corynebacteriales bacterium]|nr:hypothetical protein [Mycobacteriales bacterium]
MTDNKATKEPEKETTEPKDPQAALRKKKIFTALALGLVFALILALATFVDSNQRNSDSSEALPANSLVGWWSSFCPAHNTIAADADALNIRKNESQEEYLDRLPNALERQASDFRSTALTMRSSSVMMSGSEKQKEALQELIDVLYEGDKVFSAKSKELRANPIKTQEQMDKLSETLRAVFEKYSATTQKVLSAIGQGDKQTQNRIRNLSECKQLFVEMEEQTKPKKQS